MKITCSTEVEHEKLREPLERTEEFVLHVTELLRQSPRRKGKRIWISDLEQYGFYGRGLISTILSMSSGRDNY